METISCFLLLKTMTKQNAYFGWKPHLCPKLTYQKHRNTLLKINGPFKKSNNKNFRFHFPFWQVISSPERGKSAVSCSDQIWRLICSFTMLINSIKGEIPSYWFSWTLSTFLRSVVSEICECLSFWLLLQRQPYGWY